MRELNADDLSLLVMASLAGEELPRAAIARWVEARVEGLASLPDGWIARTVAALERRGWIRGRYVLESAGRATKRYGLTEQGAAELSERGDAWVRYARAMVAALDGPPTAP